MHKEIFCRHLSCTESQLEKSATIVWSSKVKFLNFFQSIPFHHAKVRKTLNIHQWFIDLKSLNYIFMASQYINFNFNALNVYEPNKFQMQIWKREAGEFLNFNKTWKKKCQIDCKTIQNNSIEYSVRKKETADNFIKQQKSLFFILQLIS